MKNIHITLHPRKLRWILIHMDAPVPHYHNACPTTWTCITNTKQSNFHKHTVLLALPATTLPQDLNPSDKTWWQIKHTSWQVNKQTDKVWVGSTTRWRDDIHSCCLRTILATMWEGGGCVDQNMIIIGEGERKVNYDKQCTVTIPQ